ncbi:MAG: serine/threonine-protein kinase PknK [Kofleriaceae bacterium]
MPRCPRCYRRLALGIACPDDGARLPLSPAPSPARPAIADYVLGDVLGAGGFSIVYATTNAPLAIKVAHDASPLANARFDREATALRTLASPFVPALVDSGRLDDGRPFLAMERLTAPTLADVLATANEPLPLAACVRIAERIATALAFVHARGFVHRDLKPENIVLRGDDACLLDFGLVALPDRAASLTRDGTILGSAEYMAPEQLRAGVAAGPADLYALGVLLFELITLRVPFAGDRSAIEHGHLHLRPPLPSRVRPMPETLESLILDLLAKSPERRPDLASVNARLSRALAGDTARSPAERSLRAAEGQRPVTLVHVAGALPIDQLRDLAARVGASIVRHRGANALLAILPATHDPLSAAIALAGDAATHPATRAVIHVGRALVRSTRHGVALYGRDVDQPSWLPASPWHGVVLTRAAADALGLDADGDFVPATSLDERATVSSLVGRDAVVAHVHDIISRVVREATPALCVIAGDEGTGKSTLAANIVARARGNLDARGDLDARVRGDLDGRGSLDVLRIACNRPGATAESSLQLLVRALLDVDDGVPAEPLELVAKRLPAAVGRSVVVAMGWLDGDDAARPGAIRDELRRAITAGIVHRASARPLVIVVDDAQRADDMTLEILERACETSSVPLCVVLACTARFADARKAWHRRQDDRSARRRIDVVRLEALGEADAAALVGHLLPAGTRVPAQVVARLASWSGGNPALLVDLIALLRREKIVRRHEGTNAWFVAADELDRLPPLPAAQWMATRELDALAPELADLARIASVLGADLRVDELEVVQRTLQRDGFDRAMADAATGVAQLVRERLLVERADGRVELRRPAQREALLALVPDALRSAIHAAALRYWSSQAGDHLARAAYHAAGCGQREVARAHYATLAARAKARHDYLEAERMLTAALELGDDLALLEERGAVRRFLTHYEEARADLAAARALAEELDDPLRLLSILVDEAAICDFVEEWETQAQLMERAEALAARAVLPPPLEAKYKNWLGVSRARQERADEAEVLLESAAALALELGDHETRVGCLLLLGYMWIGQGRAIDGKRALDEAIARCEAASDHYHLAIGLLNRISYWQTEGPWSRAEDDSRRSVEIAREMGFHQIEFFSLHNLSIARFWNGDLAGALAAAEQALAITRERFGAKGCRTHLQTAFLLALDGRDTDARRVLDEINDDDFLGSTADCSYLDGLRAAVARGSDDTWHRVLAELRAQGDRQVMVEMLWLRARAAMRAGDGRASLAALEEAHAGAATYDVPITALIADDLRAVRRDRQLGAA